MTIVDGRPLADVGSELQHASAEALEAFVQEHRPGALWDLLDWASQLAHAIRMRERGSLLEAAVFERGACRAFRRLPEGDRWCNPEYETADANGRPKSPP